MSRRCPFCLREQPTPEQTKADRVNALRLKRDRAKAAGMCSRCFGRPARDGMTECAVCSSWPRRKRRMTEAQLQAGRERSRRTAERRKARAA